MLVENPVTCVEHPVYITNLIDDMTVVCTVYKY